MTTNGCDDQCNIIGRLHTAVGVRSLIVDWNRLHLIQRNIRSDRLIYVVIHHCLVLAGVYGIYVTLALVKQNCTSDHLVVSTHAHLSTFACAM